MVNAGSPLAAERQLLPPSSLAYTAPPAVPTNTRLRLDGSTAIDETNGARWPASAQVVPESRLTATPCEVAAYTVAGVTGSIATLNTLRSLNPTACQAAPPSVLRKTPAPR